MFFFFFLDFIWIRYILCLLPEYLVKFEPLTVEILILVPVLVAQENSDYISFSIQSVGIHETMDRRQNCSKERKCEKQILFPGKVKPGLKF